MKPEHHATVAEAVAKRDDLEQGVREETWAALREKVGAALDRTIEAQADAAVKQASAELEGRDE